MKNVDTLDIQLCVKPTVKENIKSKLFCDDDTKYGIGGMYYGHHIYLPYGFQYICRGYYLIVKVEHQAMVGIETADELQQQVISMVSDYFNINRDDIVKYKVEKTSTSKIRVFCNSGIIISGNLGKGFIPKDFSEINRIEFKNDYKLKNADESLAAQDIFRIAVESSNRCEKVLFKYESRTNCTYTKEKNNNVAVTCYFKEFERLEKSDLAGACKYKDILRTEIKVKNKHLDNNRKHRDKTLTNYFSGDVAAEYFNKYAVPVFYTEPFFRLDIAQLEIYKSELLKDFEKDRLYQFLVDINKFGISAVKEKYDSSTFKEYSRKIGKLGINLLCFSPIIDGKEITIKKMDNFTLLQNGIAEDI